MTALDPLRNPRDPLHASGPDAEKELFRALGKDCHGYPPEIVLGAAVNLVINALRQQHATKAGAERAFDEIAARSKRLLLDEHYDNLGHRRQGTFPFDVRVVMPPLAELLQLNNKRY